MKLFGVIGVLAAVCCCWATAAPTEIKDEDLKPEARISEDVPSAQPSDSVPGHRQTVGIAIPELRQTQYSTSDAGGVYSFGYAYPEQMHTESRSSDGLVSGSYFYRDPQGFLNKVEYRADGAGFRVAANNLPVFNPEPVRDTPEVEEAKRKHFEAYEAISKHIAKSQVAQSQDETSSASLNKEPVYVAPLDLEPLPEAFAPIKVAAEDKVPAPLVPPKPEYSDVIVDEAKEAVITNQEQAGDAGDTIFEVDAEPVKLLAQFYSKHLKDNAAELKPIERPAGFHPKNLEIPPGFDIFRRSEGRDRDSIVVTNPEYVDLRAFVQTTQFRANEPEANDQASSDLSHSDDMDPTSHQSLVAQQELLNYYYGRPVFITRETFGQLPESLKIAAQGLSGVDGQHTAQVAPSQNTNDIDRQRVYRPMPVQRYVTPYSAYSSYYSPYYFYRQPYTYYPLNYQPYYRAIF